MIIKTNEIEGAALDWAVARCEGAGAALVKTHSRGEVLLLSDHTTNCDAGDHFKPSTDWAQGGPIIEREEIDLYCHESPKTGCGWWVAEITGIKARAKGITPLIAAMRCYVASKLGDEVDIPEELNDNLSPS